MRTAVGYTCGYIVYEGKGGFHLRKVGSEEFEQVYYQTLEEALQGGYALTDGRKKSEPKDERDLREVQPVTRLGQLVKSLFRSKR